MRNILIIYPHWPPSNLAGMHRARLIANFAHRLGWRVTILTVHWRHYEETVDYDMTRLVHPDIQVISTAAFKPIRIFGRRVIGDIGILSFVQTRKAMLKALGDVNFSFVWIPIPSWYTSFLGRIALNRKGVRFGIDYIDPWVYKLTSYEPFLSKAWWTRQFAILMEPLAIRNASLISGVSQKYYMAALKRVFKEKSNFPIHIAMPYGFDLADHKSDPSEYSPPWKDSSNPFMLYAGAFLPQSESFISALFQALKNLNKRRMWPRGLKIRFVGTGNRQGRSITDLAIENHVDHIVEEFSERLPFLQIQQMLRDSFANLIVGSTEPHYTASKTFQCILSERPILAIFHSDSSASRFLAEAKADAFLVNWNPSVNSSELRERIQSALLSLVKKEIEWNPNLAALNKYSAEKSAKVLFEAIDLILAQDEKSTGDS